MGEAFFEACSPPAFGTRTRYWESACIGDTVLSCSGLLRKSCASVATLIAVPTELQSCVACSPMSHVPHCAPFTLSGDAECCRRMSAGNIDLYVSASGHGSSASRHTLAGEWLVVAVPINFQPHKCLHRVVLTGCVAVCCRNLAEVSLALRHSAAHH